MRRRNTIALGLLAVTIGACSRYPLPQDSTGSTTSDIVANIRCQARRAVRTAAAQKLEELADTPVTRQYTGKMLAELLQKDDTDDELRRVDIKKIIRKDIKEAFDYYSTTVATYEFTLQMKEENRQGAGIDILRRFNRRLDVIGIGVTEDRTRDISRIFTLRDTFLNLALGISDSYCQRKPGVDLIFPAKGHLPVEDLVNTYIYLNEWGTLDVAQKPDLEGTPKGPATRQMADTIMFTTKLSSTNNPSVGYNPAGVGLLVSGLSFTNENSRSDMHKVIVTLTTADLPDGKGGFRAVSPEKLRETGDTSINSVRNKNFQDDISAIARSISQSPLSGF